ncbi:MAG: DNA recombination protein RmuC [Acidobacteriota bacterium]|jgi:DNA recombination protein RmuC|nr:MAG: DNA recombination protein RmuC [Acidobacteriota bacterium]
MLDLTSLLLGLAAGAAVASLVWLWRHQQVATRLARAEAEREAALAAVADQRELLGRTRAEVRETFAALSREALRENRSDFLQTADSLLAPVRETLDRVQAQLVDVDRAREGTFRSVAAQLQSLAAAQEQLRSTTENLARALRSPNTRGRWGELQLRRIVELAGMLHHCDFVEKASTTTADGARRTPDMVVRLPGGTTIVIDAKAPIDAYLAAVDAVDDATRQQHLAAHARQVRDHIRALGAKEYWQQFPQAPEFVVMFLPLEPLLSTAFEHDGTLLEQSAALRVIPATPMTLLALLKAVGYGWQQLEVARNAEEIRDLGRELYDRFATLVDHIEAVGRNIKQAAGSYDRFVGSLEQKLMPAARRFRALGVATTKREVETPEPLNLNVRAIRSPDLLGRIDEEAGGSLPGTVSGGSAEEEDGGEHSAPARLERRTGTS